MSMIWKFDGIVSKHGVYRGKGCIQIFCNSLREQPMNFQKEKMITLASEQQEPYEKAKICYISKKNWNIITLVIKNIMKLQISVFI